MNPQQKETQRDTENLPKTYGKECQTSKIWKRCSQNKQQTTATTMPTRQRTAESQQTTANGQQQPPKVTTATARRQPGNYKTNGIIL